MTCDFAEKFGIDTQKNSHKGGHWTISVIIEQYYAMFDNIRKCLTIFDNILILLRILQKLRKDRAEIAT